MSERFKITPAVFAFIEKEGKIVLMRRANTGYMDGHYTVPAGHVEDAELPYEAFIREVEEETGLKVKAWEQVHSMYNISQSIPYIYFFYKVTDFEGEIANIEPEKCDHIDWFHLDAIPENIIDYIADALGHLKAGVSFSEKGKGV